MKLFVTTSTGTETLEFTPGMTLLEALRPAYGGAIHAPCGGQGTCGKCTVTLGRGCTARKVLACRTAAEDGMHVVLPQTERLTVELDGQQSGIAPEEGLDGYGIACDIGTTTVVCRLVELSTGRCVSVMGEGNAQRVYGGDVIARIRAAGEGRREELRQAIVGQLSRMIMTLRERAGLDAVRIRRMSVAANTTMCHLLTGLDPAGLGQAPFTPVSRFGECIPARKLGLPIQGDVYIAPAVSGYVGGDITADLLAAGLDETDEPTLLIDVGTNGEMALGCGSRFLCCSTAAGPAFEGAQIRCGMTAAPGAVSRVWWEDGVLRCTTVDGAPAVGLCGSGLIDAAAAMLDAGAVDETGRMPDPEEDDVPERAAPYLFLTEEDEPAFRLTGNVYVTQADIRKLQLGKGAIAAGVRVLLEKFGAKQGKLGGLLLAGGFGSYIRPESAARIGLIPAELLGVTRAIGNAAVEGAQAALVSARARVRLTALQANMEYLELSGLPDFNDAYMEAMMFPEEGEG